MPLYFAYGSNMDEGQMKERCPHAQFKCVAKMTDWCLCFPRYSRKRNGGVSSIEEKPGEIVWGVVYDIPSNELPLLDKAEGYKEGRPCNHNSYCRGERQVEEANGQRHVCYVYIANRDRPYKPSRECYLNYIIRGAEHHREQGIPDDYIAKLRSIETNNIK